MKVMNSVKKIQGLALFHIFLKVIKTVNQSEIKSNTPQLVTHLVYD
jgi:hypothetical protein